MKVVIVDDDPLVVASLQTIMAAHGMTVVGTGSDGSEAKPLFERYTPDVLLMDIRMKQVNGIDAAGEILNNHADAKILLLTTFDDEEYIVRAIHFGCKGYILKQNIQSLIPAINAVMAGSIVFDSQIINKVSKSKPERKPFTDLSAREIDILELLAEGFNNKEIADKLLLSQGTVRNYISTILEKLHLRDRTQLLVYYYTNN
ncbi:MAG: response regulator transcription factor [Treponema sp.]